MAIEIVKEGWGESFVVKNPIIIVTEDDCACNTGEGKPAVVFKATASQEIGR